MNKLDRRQFRRSSKWKRFRIECKIHYARLDYITGKQLRRDWNLHHLDLRVSNYDNLSDIRKFLPLNKDTHEFIHWLYNFYKQDKNILKRIESVLVKMDMCTNGGKHGFGNRKLDTQ